MEDRVEESRFVFREDGAEAELVYRLDDGVLVVVHTGVPAAFEHRGIGGILVQAAVDRARAEHRTLAPWCPFARRWLEDHPDRHEGVEVDWRPLPR